MCPHMFSYRMSSLDLWKYECFVPIGRHVLPIESPLVRVFWSRGLWIHVFVSGDLWIQLFWSRDLWIHGFGGFARISRDLYRYLMISSISGGDRARARARASTGPTTGIWVGADPFMTQPTQAKSENPQSKACGNKQSPPRHHFGVFWSE